MKRRTLKSMVCAAIMVLTLCVTACGSKTTLEEYFSDPEVKSALDSEYAALAQDGISIDYEVKGNEFIFTFQYEDSSMIVDGMGDLLNQALDAMGDYFKVSASQFDEAIEAEEGTCTVTVRYTDPDNKVLAEKSFTAE